MKLTSTGTLVLAAVPTLDETDPERIDYSGARNADAIHFYIRENPNVIDVPELLEVDQTLRLLEKHRKIKSVFLRGRKVYWKAAPRQVDNSAFWRLFFFWLAVLATIGQVAVCFFVAKPFYSLVAIVAICAVGFWKNRKR